MMTNEQFIAKCIEAEKKHEDNSKIVTDYINQLFVDIGGRYPVNPLTRPLIYAVFRNFADVMYNDAPEDEKEICTDVYNVVKEQDCTVIKMPNIKKEDKNNDNR